MNETTSTKKLTVAEALVVEVVIAVAISAATAATFYIVKTLVHTSFEVAAVRRSRKSSTKKH